MYQENLSFHQGSVATFLAPYHSNGGNYKGVQKGMHWELLYADNLEELAELKEAVTIFNKRWRNGIEMRNNTQQKQ